MLVDKPAPKRVRPRGGTSFAETVLKRYRATRDAMLDIIDPVFPGDTDSSILPASVFHDAHCCRRANSAQGFEVPVPRSYTTSLLPRDLPVQRRRVSAPGAQIQKFANDLYRQPCEFGSSSMGYLEYQTWLHRIVPDDMVPFDDRRKSPEEHVDVPRISALELLRQLPRAPPTYTPVDTEPKISHDALAADSPALAVPALTPQEQKFAEQSLQTGQNLNEVLIKRFNVELLRKHLLCLRPQEWLNDEVINFYLSLLQERSRLSDKCRKCWIPNSFFWSKLAGCAGYNYKDVRRWTTKANIDIFCLDCIVFPINVQGMHWALGVVDMEKRGFLYFDSMFSNPHPNFVSYLRRYLEDEHMNKKKIPLDHVDDWGLLPNTSVPQQRNGFDCGVFTCCFAEHFLTRKHFSFDQDDMPVFRRRIAARIVGGDACWPLE